MIKYPMIKKVNIQAPVAVRTVNPPIHGTCTGIMMKTGDILRCLCRRAIVDEVLSDGSIVRLNMANYYKDNTKKCSTPVEIDNSVEDEIIPANDSRNEEDKSIEADDTTFNDLDSLATDSMGTDAMADNASDEYIADNSVEIETSPENDSESVEESTGEDCGVMEDSKEEIPAPKKKNNKSKKKNG